MCIYIPCVEEHNTTNISSSNIMSTRLVLLSVLALNSYKLQSGNENYFPFRPISVICLICTIYFLEPRATKLTIYNIKDKVLLGFHSRIKFSQEQIHFGHWAIFKQCSLHFNPTYLLITVTAILIIDLLGDSEIWGKFVKL